MRVKAVALVLVVALAAELAAFACLVGAASHREPDDPHPVLAASDIEREEYVVNYQKDMQYPELPTGCEATALSTLLRLNGVEASKVEVAEAMPKSDWDFVNAFFGDPARTDGWCCMAPCSAATAELFLPPSLAAVDATGESLDEVPVPFC
ncbi:C39 family peptidase, partial [Gordonibacter sp.]